MVLLAYRTSIQRLKTESGQVGLRTHSISYSGDGNRFFTVFVGMPDIYVAGDGDRPRLFAHNPEVRGTYMFGVEPYARHRPELPAVLRSKFLSLGLPPDKAAMAVEKLWDAEHWFVYASKRDVTTLERGVLPISSSEQHVFESTPSYEQRAATLKQKVRDTVYEAPIVGSLLMLAETTAGISIFGDELSDNERILLGLGVLLCVFRYRRKPDAGTPQPAASELRMVQPKLTEAEADMVVTRMQSLAKEEADAIERLLQERKRRPLTEHEQEELASIVGKIKAAELAEIRRLVPKKVQMKMYLRERRRYARAQSMTLKTDPAGANAELIAKWDKLHDDLGTLSSALGRTAPENWMYRYEVRKVPNGYKLTTYLKRKDEHIDWTGWKKHGPVDAEKFIIDELGEPREVRGLKNVPRDQIQSEQVEWLKSTGQLTDVQEVFIHDAVADEFFKGFPDSEFHSDLRKRGLTGGGFE